MLREECLLELTSLHGAAQVGLARSLTIFGSYVDQNPPAAWSMNVPDASSVEKPFLPQ